MVVSESESLFWDSENGDCDHVAQVPTKASYGGHLQDKEPEIGKVKGHDNVKVKKDNSALWWKKFIALIQRLVGDNGSDGGSSTEKMLDWAICNAAKVVSSTSPQDEQRRTEIVRSIVETRDGIPSLLKALEGTVKSTAGTDLSLLLRECTNPRNGNHRATAVRLLTDGDAHLDTIFTILQQLQENVSVNAKSDSIATTVNVIWVLSAMAQKDANFVAKIRTKSKVKFLHTLMKSYFFGKHHTHYPFLKILRVLVKNKKVASTLGKDKIMHLIQKMFNAFNNQPSPKFLIMFEILAQLTQQKENGKRFLKAGLLVFVMRAFTYWELWRGNGLLKLSKLVTSIYSHLCLIRAGRKALVKTEALEILHKFCEQAPAEKSFDDVLTKIAAIIYKAHRKDKLALDDLMSPCRFATPVGVNSKPDVRDSGASSSDDEDADHLIEPEDSEDEDDRDSGDEEDANNNTLDSEGDEAENDDDHQDDVIGLRGVSGDALDDDSLIIDDERVVKPWKERPKAVNPPLSNLQRAAGDCISFTMSEEKAVRVTRLFREFETEESGRPAEELKGDFFEDMLRESSFGSGCNGSNDKLNVLLPKAEPKFFWWTDNPEYGGTDTEVEARQDYFHVANQVKAVVPFVKIAYPDYMLAYGSKRIEYLCHNADRGGLRNKLLQHMARGRHEGFKAKTVYDLDMLVASVRKGSLKTKQVGSSGTLVSNPFNPLGNDDELLVGKFDGRKDNPAPQPLKFESRFESGNLRKAVQVGDSEYDLFLNSDVNSDRNNQWFYFQVSNVLENIPYTFNIVNCIKPGSQFNFGMQPVVFSVGDCMDGKPGWYRCGSQIFYYKNGYRNTTAQKKRFYYTATFTMNFHRRGDVCYVAYHYPYTYSRMLTELKKLEKTAAGNNKLLFRIDSLCKSLNGNPVPLVTFTANKSDSLVIEEKPIIVLTARVHPGESNASWVMHGILNKLVTGKGIDWANAASKYVFKIVPMLNPEGVINGCHRCGLTNEDLNRRWKTPDPVLHPTIYWTKALIEYCCEGRQTPPVVFCDLHGHSARKNVFFYGCSNAKSWLDGDKVKPENVRNVLDLPEAMEKRSEAFSVASCKFEVQKHRESTARVAVWRQFGIQRSFTLESSYCGCDKGNLKGFSLGIHHLIGVGENLVYAIGDIDPANNDGNGAEPGSILALPAGVSDDRKDDLSHRSASYHVKIEKHNKPKARRRRRTQPVTRSRTVPGVKKRK